MDWCATQASAKQETVWPQRTALTARFARATAALLALHPLSVRLPNNVYKALASRLRLVALLTSKQERKPTESIRLTQMAADLLQHFRCIAI